MKLLSETKALAKLKALKDEFRGEIVDGYEHHAKSCLTCETTGACCLDAHFVNVHISRLEAVAIKQTLRTFSPENQAAIGDRIGETIEKYALKTEGDTFEQTYACPLFEKGIGCLVHNTAKPLACITHACSEKKEHLPPAHLLTDREVAVDDLNEKTYGQPQPWLPLPLAIKRLT